MVTLDLVSAVLSRSEKSRLASAAHHRYLAWTSRFEVLEPRTLLSSTLYVTDPSVAVDATHFHTLQSALLVAGDGDTIMLQPGFSAGTFVKTALSAPAHANDTVIHTTLALDVGEVVTIGSFTAADPAERDLVTGVTAGSGDFLISLAAPLAANHTGSPVDATNSSSSGPLIGINKSITLTASSLLTLPFGLELWPTTSGVTVSNLQVPYLSVISDHNTLNNVTVTGVADVYQAHQNTFTGLTVTGQFGQLLMDAGSSFNTVSNSNLNNVRLVDGSHDNTFVGDTFATLVTAVGNSHGHDTFQNSTFTKAVLINGNASADTDDAFIGNTFTVTKGDALTLEHAHGTVVQGNTFSDSADSANALTVHNSTNVVASGNTFTMTGNLGAGIYAYADGTGSTSVDVSNNVMNTGNGFGIYFGKYDVTASFDARVQFNDLRNNAVGVFIDGDGASAGTVDLGVLPGQSGGSMTFGASDGMNDFSTFTSSDDTHYAIGLFDTSAGFTVRADNDLWTVANPLNVVADSTHTTAAAGTGIIEATPFVPTPPTPTETLAATANNLAVVQTGTTSGIVASFSSNLARVASDFTVTIDWGDGTSSQGIVAANTSGGFDVMASHAWPAAGNATFTVSIMSNSTGATTSAQGSVAVTPRVLALTPQSFSIDKKNPFNGTVATFTDNLAGTAVSSYVASVTWSDGMTTTATIVKNSDGSFSVNTSRGFTQTGVLIASVSVGTTDGLFSGVASLTATVTNKNDKVPPGKDKKLNQLTVYIQMVMADTHKHDHDDCKLAKKAHGCCR